LLRSVRTDHSKAPIRTPINGVVLVRSVEPGQTVAATMTAPVLFTLAEDLKKMELHVSVDEADVGSVEVGQKATFTVDAFANRRFEARITRVHLASSNTGSSSNSAQASATSTGVVTYQTVLEVDNSEQMLRPGMTATAEIITTSIEDAILVPNAALRFTPPDQQLPGPGAPQGPPGGAFQVLMPQFRGRFGGSGGQQGGRRVGQVWVLENGKPELVVFRPGATDGRFTQVLPLDALPNNMARANNAFAERFAKAMERKLEPGMKVIVDAETPKS
jgi:HlyD family secretion protein